MSLADALRNIDATFGIDKILMDEGRDILRPYYIQSEPGYKHAHSQKGCMHVALNADGQFDPDGYFTQIREVAAQIRATGARKVLELGSGMGFNTLALAPDLPEVSFTGLDLMDHHVRNAQNAGKQLRNVGFVQGSYNAIPTELHGADVVFGIETLCYATDLDLIARNIAQALSPGGRFVMYEPLRRPDMDSAGPDVVLATRLFEVTTAVTSGFGTLAAWQGALTRAGLRVTRIEDLTDDSIACMRALHLRSARFFQSWKYKLIRHVMPRRLILNAVAGLTGPYTIEGVTPDTGNTGSCLTYTLMIAEKPA